MKFSTLLLLSLAGAAAYWAYRNGVGAWVGICPPGYTLGSDMFPVCTNDMYTAGANLGIKAVAGPMGTTAYVDDPATQALAKTRPTTALPFPLVWGWNGSTWVQVTEAPVWP